MAYIGLFMMEASVQQAGIGTRIVEDLCRHLAEEGIRTVRLCWVKGNPQAEHFWRKNQFAPIRETQSMSGQTVVPVSYTHLNGEILDELLTKWEEMGYTFHPLSELCEK